MDLLAQFIIAILYLAVSVLGVLLMGAVTIRIAAHLQLSQRRQNRHTKRNAWKPPEQRTRVPIENRDGTLEYVTVLSVSPPDGTGDRDIRVQTLQGRILSHRLDKNGDITAENIFDE